MSGSEKQFLTRETPGGTVGRAKNKFLSIDSWATRGRRTSERTSKNDRQAAPRPSPGMISTRANWEFGSIPIHPPERAGVGRLPVSWPGDAAEGEADAMADRALSKSLSSTASAAEARSRPPATGEKREANTIAGSTASWLGGGRPLDRATRDYFEPRFGADFGDVRLHDSDQARQAAAKLRALAFTIGQRIAFGNGQPTLGTEGGRRLIAHELAHTLQQRIDPGTGIIQRRPIPGQNFTPADYAKLQGGGKKLTIAADSGWFPAKLQENLLKTLDFLLGSKVSPAPTEGVNAMDFFHGHLVVKKDPEIAKKAIALNEKDKHFFKKLTALGTKTDPATEKLVKGADTKSDKFYDELKKARTEAIGDVDSGKGKYITKKDIAPYQKAIEKVIPSFTSLLEDTLKIPGAAVMYHTFEMINPSDLKAKGETLADEDARSQYVTPLDTNVPVQYSSPKGGTYEREYTHIAKFAFLVNAKGEVSVRPFDTRSGYTSLELSTITGTTFPEPFDLKRQ